MFTHSERAVKPNVHCQSDDAAGPIVHNLGMAKSDKNKPGDFGRNLKEKRQRFGMTMDVLAEKAAVSKSYISSLESGSRLNPSEGMARRLADVFQCDVAELWGRSQSSFEARALELLRSMPEARREAAIAALYGLAAGSTKAA